MSENQRREEENESSVDNVDEYVGIDKAQDSDEIVQGVDNNELYEVHDLILMAIMNECYFYDEDDDDNTAIIKMLDKYPMAAQHKNEDDGCLPLHTACLSHVSENVLMKLIDLYPEAASIKCIDGWDYTIRDAPIYVSGDCFALHLACRYGRSEKVIRKLIEINPMALQERSNDGDYPIHCIYHLYNLDKEVFRILLDSDPLAIQHKNKDGDTALHLSSHGVLLGSQDDEYQIPILEYMVQQHSTNGLINIRNCKGETPLHTACLERFDKGVETLLKHPDINPNATNMLNQTPLHCVLFCPNNNNLRQHLATSANIVKKLVDHPNIYINQKNNYNETTLDLVQEEIRKQVTNGESLNLQEWITANELLVEFTIKRRYDAFCFLLRHVRGM